MGALKARVGGAWEEVAVGSSRMVGEIVMWALPTAPAGWVLCQGQSAAPYPALNTLLVNAGYPYGGSAGTALLPDTKSRLMRGVGSNATLGSTDGLVDGDRELQHRHNITSGGGHTHGAGTLASDTLADRAVGSSNRAANPITGSTATDGAHDHGGLTGLNVGSELLPNVAFNVIIYAGT